jgi:hypothetical protein
MRPKSAIRLQNGETVIIAVPDVEGGHFTQELGLDRKTYLGEIALISGIPSDYVFDAGHDPLEFYQQQGLEPGLLEMINGAKVTLVIGSKADQELTDNIIADEVRHTRTQIREFQPYNAT